MSLYILRCFNFHVFTECRHWTVNCIVDTTRQQFLDLSPEDAWNISFDFIQIYCQGDATTASGRNRIILYITEKYFLLTFIHTFIM